MLRIRCNFNGPALRGLLPAGHILPKGHPMKRIDRRTGFTLIEVLVVVAIIALLVSILPPSLALAREPSYGAVCLSNVKQAVQGITAATLHMHGEKMKTPGVLVRIARCFPEGKSIGSAFAGSFTFRPAARHSYAPGGSTAVILPRAVHPFKRKV